MTTPTIILATEMVNIPSNTTTSNGGDIELGLPQSSPPVPHPDTPAAATTNNNNTNPNNNTNATNDNVGKGFLKPLPETTLLERGAGIVAVVSVGTAVAAMIIEQTLLVYIGAIFSCMIGPYCYYQQTKLTDIRSLQETKTAITEEVNQLTSLNQRLIQNITNLTTSVDRLEEIEQALNVLTNTQGQSIDAFQKQVTENQQLLSQMKKNVQANVLQNLLSVVLRSDTNQDMIMNEIEITNLIRRLQNIAGVQVQEVQFRKAIQDQSISSIMTIIQNLLRPDIPETERIFTFVKSSTS
jgi:glutaredoxin 2